MWARLCVFLLLFGAGCEGTRARSGGGTVSRPRVDGGVTDAGASPMDSGPSDRPDAGGPARTCRIELPVPSGAEAFDWSTYDTDDGWSDVRVDGFGARVPADAPVELCPGRPNGTFLFEADGTSRTLAATSRIRIRFEGYTRPGSYIIRGSEGLEVALENSGFAGGIGREDTMCQVCVEPGGTEGLFRCSGLHGLGTNPIDIVYGAFRCR